MNILSSSPTLELISRNITKRSIIWVRLGIHVIGLLPLTELIYKWRSDLLTANPIQFVEQFFGHAAINLLVATLAVTPLVTLTGWKVLAKHRRAMGLYTFLYFSLHLFTFVVVDYGLDWEEILYLTTEKPFIFVGLLAGLILLVLAVTSFKFWMKRLGKNWKKLHKTIYLAGALVVLHYAWALKGDVTNLSGDIVGPISMGVLVTLLLILRIPFVRRSIVSLRQRAR